MKSDPDESNPDRWLIPYLRIKAKPETDLWDMVPPPCFTEKPIKAKRQRNG